MKRVDQLALGLGLIATTGCSGPAALLGIGGGAESRADRSAAGDPLPQGPAIAGRVDWGADRQTRATTGDIVTWSTVALIDLSRQQTIQTTLSDERGAFFLPPLGIAPPATHSYALEAIKGLSSHLPGKDALRLRLNLVALRENGTYRWLSPLETSDGSFVIGISSTALAVAFSHRQDTTGALDLGQLIGSIEIGKPWSEKGLPDTYVAPAAGGLTADEFAGLWAMVWQAVLGDRDPVEAIRMDSASLTFSMPTDLHAVTGVSPASGKVGDTVTVSGSNFIINPASANRVFFGEAEAQLLSASPTSLVVKVPAGAESGGVQVRIGSYAVVGPRFDVK